MPLDVVAVLRAHRQRSPFTAVDDPVFAREDGSPMTHHQVQCKLRRLVKAGIESRPELGSISPHTFRRSYASRLIAHRASVGEVAAAFGHSDPAVTLTSYSFAFEEAQRSDARRARLEEAFAGAFGGRVYHMATSAPGEAPIELPAAA